MIQVGILGALGRMGLNNAQGVIHHPKMQLKVMCDSKGHPSTGTDISSLLLSTKAVPLLTDDMEKLFQESDCVIDFTSPEATMSALQMNMGYRKPMVIGTTGFTAAQMDVMKQASNHFAIIYGSNFSIGVNVLFAITEKVASILNKAREYDLEICEIHHRFKKDAPSGTAKELGRIARLASGRDPEKDFVVDRTHQTNERSLDELGISSLRLGDVIGDHTVYFSTIGERLELTHRAHSRDTFTKGVLLAVEFLASKKAGWFSMKDLLDL